MKNNDIVDIAETAKAEGITTEELAEFVQHRNIVKNFSTQQYGAGGYFRTNSSGGIDGIYTPFLLVDGNTIKAKASDGQMKDLPDPNQTPLRLALVPHYVSTKQSDGTFVRELVGYYIRCNGVYTPPADKGQAVTQSSPGSPSARQEKAQADTGEEIEL